MAKLPIKTPFATQNQTTKRVLKHGMPGIKSLNCRFSLAKKPSVMINPNADSNATTPPADRAMSRQQWVEAQLSPAVTITAQAADASFRQYHRVTGHGQPLILMDAPPEKESVHQFLKVQALLAQHGVRVPQIVASDEAQGFILLEDFGDTLLSRVIAPDNVDTYYSQAINQLLEMQQIPLAALSGLPRYNEIELMREIRLFDEWFLPKVLNRALTDEEQSRLNQAYQIMLNEIAAQPIGLVHRDFHSRNLMALADETVLGVIDFQDAIAGPMTYDLVSLLRDAYLYWPADQVEHWVKLYWQRAEIRGLLPHTPFSTLMRWFDQMGLQRHLKILGIFVRLWQRDGKTGYLKDLPLVMRYTLAESARLPELGLHDWLVNVVAPAFEQQHPAWLQQAGVTA